MDRVILHCDCNNYFASVELLERPDLRELPVAVAGDPEGRHGIILAKNQLAKKYGVKTAETIWQAQRKCPGLILLPPHMEKYKAIKRHSTPPITKIHDDRCGGCNMQLPAADMNKIRTGAPYVECENCGRIILVK